MIKPRMPEAAPPEVRHAQREYRLVLLGLFAVVVLRAGVLVFWERAQFDADQAITGLMAKHLAEGRAFPLFYYGQSYMLAVEAWLAAPLFALAGASVAALKLPLLVINLLIVWLLLRGFVFDGGLRPALAAVPVMVFALPAPSTAARFVEAMGGNVEPFLYALLMWTLRRRPGWCGIVLGIGFLQREFTLYGFLALLAIETLRGELLSRDGLRRRLTTLRTAAEVWLVVYFLRQFSSAAGPGTTLDDLSVARDNITELTSRMCLDPSTALKGFGAIVSTHWPTLFGTGRHPVADFGINSSVSQGGIATAILLGLMVLVPVAGLVLRMRRPFRLGAASAFSVFLVMTAAFSILGYVVGRCGAIDIHYTRYEMLSVLGLAGLWGWFLTVAQGSTRWMPSLAVPAIWFTLLAVPHVQMWTEYIRRPPLDVRRLIIAHLDARGITRAASDYWMAYPTTFLSRERIIVRSEDFVRVQEYERLIDAQGGRVPRISRTPCEAGGHQIVPRVYLCEP
jgi:hypothetical protein